MIPGWLVSIVTFPGVIVHEFAHQLFCRLLGVEVHKVCYFRFGNPAGYVIHEAPVRASQSIWIGVGPFFVNTIAGFVIAFPAATGMIQGVSQEFIRGVMLWLGVSIAMHSFPSTGDAKTIWQAVWSKEASWAAKLIGTPVVAIIYLGAIGSVFWLDLAYGIGVAVFLPKALLALGL